MKSSRPPRVSGKSYAATSAFRPKPITALLPPGISTTPEIILPRIQVPRLPLPPRKNPKRQSFIDRLAQPKAPDRRHVPDKPSIYWCDHVIDQTPLKLKDAKELASYYDNFEPRFPRTRLLSAPKTQESWNTKRTAELWSRPTTRNGIPFSALKYKASERINELARPRTAFSPSPSSIELKTKEIMDNFKKSSRISLPPIKPDLSRGDFSRIPRCGTALDVEDITPTLPSLYNGNNKKPQTARSLFSLKH